MYLAPFLSYLTLKNTVILKSRLDGTPDHWKWHHSIDPYDFLLAVHSNYGPILYRIRDKTRQSQNGIFFIPRLRNNNGCEHFRAVFFFTDPWPTRWLINTFCSCLYHSSSVSETDGLKNDFNGGEFTK